MRTDIYEILKVVSQSPYKKVLATIVDVDGSSYRKEGATMLFQENGTQVGLLSGGCLEVDLQKRISQYGYQPPSQLITYDLSAEDDLSWGQGSGCNGVVKVLIESVTQVLSNDLANILTIVNDGQDVRFVRAISQTGQVMDYLFWLDNQRYFGQWKRNIPDVEFIQEDKLIEFEACESHLFIKKIEARSRIIIYGAGPDAVPLAFLAKQLGYHIVVVDWRTGYCNEDYFPHADERIIAFPQELEQKLCLRETDAFILMTHSYEKDKQLIDLLLLKRLKYVGILGSRTRAEKLLSGRAIPAFFHFPIGLPIGSEGPNEIAVSIIAEIISVKQRV
ncbi:XdhC family protein [Metabacillus litoralis]|uniref:XdhC family protein n=1 Tax=Metabacillus litoralis TaxID=152268 RepID=UPI001CFD5A96|nr:XdhC/CoxI family protein [Metabacillus litoralis]